MVQRIKVQSGQIVYESADSSYDINVSVNGSLDVVTEVNVGTGSTGGLITTGTNQSLEIIADGIGTLSLSGGVLTINGSTWPATTGDPTQVLTTDGTGGLYWSDNGGTGSVIGTVTTGIHATGIDISTATPIASNFNQVITSDVGGGVILPSGVIGQEIFVFNQSENDILVYPDTILSQIDIYGFSTGYLLEAGYRVAFVPITVSQWYTLGVPFIPTL
jgi:hypothetical protein